MGASLKKLSQPTMNKSTIPDWGIIRNNVAFVHEVLFLRDEGSQGESPSFLQAPLDFLGN
jgi:hypothetical protein